MSFPGGTNIKNVPAIQKTQVQFPGKEDPLEKGTATHYNIAAENPMDRGVWLAAVPGVAKSWTQLSD